MFKSIVTFIKNTIAKLSAFFGVSKKKFVVSLAVTSFFFVFGAYPLDPTFAGYVVATMFNVVMAFCVVQAIDFQFNLKDCGKTESCNYGFECTYYGSTNGISQIVEYGKY